MKLRSVGSAARNLLYRQVGRANGRYQRHRQVPVDLLESDDAILVVFDAPGAELSDLQVRYVDGAVRFRVDRYRPFFDGFEMRFPGRSMALDGRVELPEDVSVDPDAATAHLSAVGTVTIEVPKVTDDEALAGHQEVDADTTVTTKSDGGSSGESRRVDGPTDASNDGEPGSEAAIEESEASNAVVSEDS